MLIDRRGGHGGGRAHHCCCRRRWRPGTSPCSGWGPSSLLERLVTPRGSLLLLGTSLRHLRDASGQPSQPALGPTTGGPARFSTHDVRGSRFPTGLDAPRGGGGWLPSRSVRFVQCSVLRCRTRSGGAVLHKRCPVAAVVTYGCLIDRFCTWPYSACIHCSPATFVQPPAGCTQKHCGRWGSSMAKYCFLRSASSQN